MIVNQLLIFISFFILQYRDSISNANEYPFAPQNELSAYIFLSETCPICISLTPEIKRIESDFKDKGVAVYLIFPNTKDSKQASIDLFVKKYKLHSPASLDMGQIITKKFGATITPEVFLIEDKSEKVIYSGKINDEYIALGKRKRTGINHLLSDAIQNYLEGDRNIVTSTKAVGCFIIKEKL